MKKKWKIVAAVAAICFCILLYLVLTVAMSGLLAAFPQYSEDTVLLVLSLPCLSALAAILLMPALLRRFTKRCMVIVLLLCLLAGGGICLLFDRSLPMLIVASLLMGLPYGGLASVYPLIVKANFTREESTGVIGIGACMMQLGCLLSKFIGGYLADIRWNYVYFTYFFAVIALLMVCLWLPKEEPPARQPGGKRPPLSLAPLKSRRIWIFAVIAFLFPVLYFIISTHISLYVEGYGLGTAALTGQLSAVGAAAATVLSLLFPKILKLTRSRTFETGLLVMGLGYLFAGLHVSSAGMLVAVLTGAAGISLFTPYLNVRITMEAKPEDAPLLTSFILTVVNVAYFACPYINNWCSRLLGDGSPASVFAISGAGCLLTVVALLFLHDPANQKA